MTQRERALMLANRTRSAQAAAKTAIAGDPSRAKLCRLILAGELDDAAGDRLAPDRLESLRVIDALKAAPAIGHVKARRYLGEAGIPPLQRLYGLTNRQRVALVGILVGRQSRLHDEILAAYTSHA